MTQYNNLTVKLFNKLRSGMKNDTDVTLNLLLNMIDNFNDEYNFRHKLLLTNTQWFLN